MKCLYCAQEVIYAGIPVAHLGRVIPLQDEGGERHLCTNGRGGIALMQEQFIVPLYDGKLVIGMILSFN